MRARYSACCRRVVLLPLAPLGEGRDPVGGQPLRIAGKRRRHIAIHAVQHRDPGLDVVSRLHDAVEGVTAHARVEQALLFVCPGNALEPFRVRELSLEIPGRAKCDIDRGCAGRSHVDRLRAFEVVAHRPDAKGMRAGLEPARWKEIPALGVADHAHRDRGAVPLGGDDDAFHGTFRRGGDLPGQCDLRACLWSRRRLRVERDQRRGDDRDAYRASEQDACCQHDEPRSWSEPAVRANHSPRPPSCPAVSSGRTGTARMPVIASQWSGSSWTDRRDDDRDRRTSATPRSLSAPARLCASPHCGRPGARRQRPRSMPTTSAGSWPARQRPEAGVWVIAETDDLDTGFRKIVVTDDDGRFLVPDLPEASYRVWVRGYGLVDSEPVTAEPGQHVSLEAVPGRHAPGGSADLSSQLLVLVAQPARGRRVPGNRAGGEWDFPRASEPGGLGGHHQAGVPAVPSDGQPVHLRHRRLDAVRLDDRGVGPPGHVWPAWRPDEQRDEPVRP